MGQTICAIIANRGEEGNTHIKDLSKENQQARRLHEPELDLVDVEARDVPEPDVARRALVRIAERLFPFMMVELGETDEPARLSAMICESVVKSEEFNYAKWKAIGRPKMSRMARQSIGKEARSMPP